MFSFQDNFAQGKPTAQSSTNLTGTEWSGLFGYSDEAVDGQRSTYLYAKTDFSTNPWWRVDLEELLPVSEIFILSGDGGLNEFEIRVGKCGENEIIKSISNFRQERRN